MSTAYHAKYFAHELTKRCSSESVEKLVESLADAQVDLNPHQVEAALFAFQSPLSKGAILADEVGLGKTIEAGLLLSQQWAERKRKLLIILPSNLRKQWSQELADKFFLPSAILETRSFNEAIRKGNLNPFQQDSIVICSYQFARTKEPYVQQVEWDLVIIDEAHRLRNVYKPTNKIANSIKKMVTGRRKVLLTATPLQNSLLELFGLVSILDDHTFGDFKSFKNQFTRLDGDDGFADLKERLRPICKRTLRKQVLEYVSYTNRHALVQEFIPTEEEQRLYDLVSDYLQRPSLYALPSSQRQLMTLILRRLLASSTYAISHTLEGLAEKLEKAAHEQKQVEQPPEGIEENYENFDELVDEWDDDSEEDETVAKPKKIYSPEELEELGKESALLREFHQLAKSIIKNSKGEVLLKALRSGFAASEDAQKRGNAPMLQQKAIIFTESRRTQEYLLRVLESAEFSGKVVLFNGSNNDPKSKEIYQKWMEKHDGTDRVSGSPTADKRAALVDYFRDEAIIMIATEAAAEGINLQFCNLVVNYDLPWNPQRIEQRIGRCHRYGQKYDVVVVNFLNKKNAADQRVYQLLKEKFRLFDGVFGASDEVLGTIESGVDFEKRIGSIYQSCRSEQQIEFEFDQLQQEMEGQIGDRKRDAREKLLNNFDHEVVEKVKVDSKSYLNKYEDWLWQITRYYLQPYAQFEDGENAFTLNENPFPEENIHPGPYRSGRGVEDANLYRVRHPLAQKIIGSCRELELEPRTLNFNHASSGKKITILDSLRGSSGWLRVSLLTVSSFEVEDHLLVEGVTDAGESLDSEICRQFFSLPAEDMGSVLIPMDEGFGAKLEGERETKIHGLLQQLQERDGRLFEREMEKLDGWASDLKNSLETELKDLDRLIKETKREAQLAPILERKVELHKTIKDLEKKRADKRRNLFEAQDEVDGQKEELLKSISGRLKQGQEIKELFVVRWTLR